MSTNYYLALRPRLALDNPDWGKVHIGHSTRRWAWQVIHKFNTGRDTQVCWPSLTLNGRELPELTNSKEWYDFLDHLDDYGLIVVDEYGDLIESLPDIIEGHDSYLLPGDEQLGIILDDEGNTCIDREFC